MSDTVFFILSKLFWFVAQPESWIVFFLLFARRAVRAQRMAAIGFWVNGTLLFVLFMGFVPLGQLIMRPLEQRYPSAPDIAPPAGIIVLGGGEDGAMSAASGLPETNGAGDRMSAGVALALAYPDAKLIFTGGSGQFLAGGVSGAIVAKAYFESLGVDPERIILEGRARNTAENAAFSRELVDDPRIGPWVLVTSAFHMPRSLATFCAAGWRDITPFPVDYRSITDLEFKWDPTGNFEKLNLSIKEWIGLLAYEWTGRIDVMFSRGC
ncbi:hypothetical protein RAZWK3B_00010 [Roseobacter sp. AzwK-3b]|uniref:YdcF family protein n=1 Tax=Roseobacter sp. AzwK-3b TaxID=351016 RepID=UPI000156A84C|nr:YdcF family protein [Roseobacter sp. AzwK-3b]EDM69885.1 hypothetical protein RAZWK3B_00010 [Roseobacter sp. AzwK-3b]